MIEETGQPNALGGLKRLDQPYHREEFVKVQGLGQVFTHTGGHDLRPLFLSMAIAGFYPVLSPFRGGRPEAAGWFMGVGRGSRGW